MTRRYDRRRDMRRRMRDMRDRARRRRRSYDMAIRRRDDDREYRSRRSSSDYLQPDYAERGMGYERRRERDRHYDYPHAESYGWGDDYGYDYDDGEEYLTDDELMEWSKDLLHEVEDKDKVFFTKDNIEQKAQIHGIHFDDDYTFAEFYTAALMAYTDYKDTLGTGNMDTFLLLAKDWLEDDDAELQGGEKLAAYYDKIVCGED